MSLPFVSRGRFDDAQRQIADLKLELADAKKERKVLADVIAGKALGFSIYGEHQMPKEVDDEPEARQYSPEKDANEPIIPKADEVTPMRARDRARQVERGNLEHLAREEKEAERLRELARETLAVTIREGRERAQVPVNGNGAH